jgi:Spy/CpxP family protein refolding chaperone
MNFKTKIMKTKTLIIAHLCPLFMLAQHPPISKKKMQQIESQKIAFITKEVNLTPEEAQEFWPVYNQYTKEMHKLRKEKHESLKRFNIEISEEVESEKLEDVFLTYTIQKEVKYEKELAYLIQFKEILGIKKAGKLILAEEKFKKELLHRIKDRKPRH